MDRLIATEVHLFERWNKPRTAHKDASAEISHLVRTLPLFSRLNTAERRRLTEMAGIFLRRKTIEGAAGLVVTDYMRRLVALQACLPVLALDPALYAGWYAVILYPDEFRAPHEYLDDAGVVHQGDRDLSGESWQHGPIILAWSHVQEDVLAPEPAGNVTIHELAHKLDLLNGAVNGMPPLHRGMDPGRWSAVFTAAYEDLRQHLERHLEPPIDPYAAHSPGEFFAVVSELFFVWPESLVETYPQVYRELAAYYRQDPGQRSGQEKR